LLVYRGSREHRGRGEVVRESSTRFIPGAWIGVGVFAVLALIRFACLKIQLKDSPGTVIKSEVAKEAPVKFRHALLAICDTAGTLGASMAGGLLLS
jgi:hypothetical protein